MSIGLQAGMLRYVSAGSYDADAQTWFTAVEAVSSISTANKVAVSAFVAGCKSDGVWTAIKASCLLCAADDLTGALVPLVGSAPTNTSFVFGDYSRTAGLIGNTSKHLSANRNTGDDPQDNAHMATWVTTAPTSGVLSYFMGGTGSAPQSYISQAATNALASRFRTSSTSLIAGEGITTGFKGVSRSASAQYIVRTGGANSTRVTASAAITSNAMGVFSLSTTTSRSDARLAFYSFGEALDLALLDARLATLMAALT